MTTEERQATQFAELRYKQGKKEGRQKAFKEFLEMIDESYPDVRDEFSATKNRENVVEWKDEIIQKLKEKSI